MQDKIDYLSEKRRLHYQKWKKGILLLIEELEQRDEMEQEAEWSSEASFDEDSIQLVHH